MVNDNPPPYEYGASESSQGQKPLGPVPASTTELQHKNSGDPHGEQLLADVPAYYTMQAGPSYAPAGSPAMIHHYVNPVTGERISSVLPPDHPEMICLQEGRHIRRTRFGLLGVLAAVLWFPLGIGLCLLDRRVTCERCGRTIVDGILC